MKANSLFLLLSICFFSISSFAQTNRAVTELDITTSDYQLEQTLGNHHFSYSTEIEIPFQADGPFIAVSIGWEQENADGRMVQLLYNNTELHFNHHIEQASDRQKSELVFINSESVLLPIKIITEGTPSLSVKVHFFNPGFSATNANTPSPSTENRSLLCPCPQPEFMSRDAWCPNNDCPPNPFPSTTFARHLIVHHSAGVNESNDWPAIVRGIWDYHVNTLGWSDVGYNWLVDPEGNLYEGRGKDVLGAHFCGANSQTAGICMLGTYTSELPPAAATNTLKEMLAWYCCEDDIDPLNSSSNVGTGLNLNHISGHRDGCATECPGDAFYPTLSDIREAVANHIEFVCTPGQPDLLIESVVINQDTIFEDDPVLVVTKVKNVGNVTVDSVFVRATFGGAELSLNIVENLEPDELNIVFDNLIFPDPGSAEFCVSIDTVLNEPDIDNNTNCMDIEVQAVVAVQELELGGFSLFPNPSDGIFIFENPDNKSGEIFIYNALGQLIFTEHIQNQTSLSINLVSSAKGLYFSKVKTQTGNYFKKLVLQ